MASIAKGKRRPDLRNREKPPAELRPTGALAGRAFPLRCAWSFIALPIKGSSGLLERCPTRSLLENRRERRYRERPHRNRRDPQYN